MNPPARAEFELTCNPKSSKPEVQARALPSSAGERTGGVLLGYRRRLEKDQKDAEGEDFAWLAADEDRVTAVLADGVTQSFFGQIAAQQIVNGLSAYIKNGNSIGDSKELIAILQSIAHHAAKLVAGHSLREDISSTMRELLEEERLKGSEAVFGAFEYDRKRRTLTVCQVGDVRVRVFRRDGKGPITADLVSAGKMGRFSTLTTAKLNDPSLVNNLVVQSFDSVVGVLIHSDGVNDEWGECPAAVGHGQEVELATALDRWAAGDDVSVVGAFTNFFLDWAASNTIVHPEPRQGSSKFTAPPPDETPRLRDSKFGLNPGFDLPEQRLPVTNRPVDSSSTTRTVDRPIVLPTIRDFEPRIVSDPTFTTKKKRRPQTGRTATLVVSAVVLASASFYIGRLTAPTPNHGASTTPDSTIYQNNGGGNTPQTNGALDSDKIVKQCKDAQAAIRGDENKLNNLHGNAKLKREAAMQQEIAALKVLDAKLLAVIALTQDSAQRAKLTREEANIKAFVAHLPTPVPKPKKTPNASLTTLDRQEQSHVSTA